jgi:hypothetical protein
MKKLFTLCMVILLVIAFTASASVDLELNGGMEIVLEWDDGMSNNPSNPDNPNDKYPVYIELSGELIETDGYVWGKIISDERTSHSGFAGWAPQTDIADATTVMRFTSPSTAPHGYGSGNAEGRRYYQVSYGGGSDITRDLVVAFNATNDGVTSDPIHVWIDDGTDESWYQPGGSTSPVSATAATVPSGTSFWFFGPADIARLFIKICFEGAAHVPENDYIRETRIAGQLMHTEFRYYLDELGLIGLPNQSPFRDQLTTSLDPIPEEIVDWVYVVIRTDVMDTSPASQLYETSAFVNKEGDLLDSEGTYGVAIPDVSGDAEVYALVRSKNHLTVSTHPIQLNDHTQASPYDFTTGTNMSYPAVGSHGMTEDPLELTNGATVNPATVYAVRAADGDLTSGHSYVEGTDRSYAIREFHSFGYLQTDYDYSGYVEGRDAEILVKKAFHSYTLIPMNANLLPAFPDAEN